MDKRTDTDQENRIERPEKDPNSQLTFEKKQRQFNEERIVFSTNDDITTVQKNESRQRLHKSQKLTQNGL